MPDLPEIPCIANMVKIMGETMSESQAKKMLDEATRRTQAVIDSEKIPAWAAAAKVANQMKQEQKMLGAIAKRTIAMDAGARLAMTEKVSGKGVIAKNFQKFIQTVEDLGNALGSRHIAGFFSDLREAKQLDGWLDRKNHLAIWQELEQQNFKRLGLDNKVGYTGNEQAKAIAESFFKRRMDIQAQNNRWGAHTEEVPGYMFLQTHSSDKLRDAGKGHKLFGSESITASYNAWRSVVDTLNIDWGRTLAGEDKDSFLKNFHNAIYTGIHGDPIEQSPDIRKFKRPGGSLADKLSSQRSLWFADAESAYKYNENWGRSDTAQTIVNTLRTGGKNTAMLMQLGTRPADNVELVRQRLTESVYKTRPEDAQSQANELRSSRIPGQMDLLTGKASASTRPWLSDAVDFLKNITLAGKGGQIILSAFADKAFLSSRMAYEGLSRLDIIGKQFQIAVGTNPRLAAEFGIFSHSLAGANQTRWDGEIRPVLGSHWLVEKIMRFQGINRWTASNQGGMGMVVAQTMARDANLPFEKLEARRQKVLTEYGFTPQEWDVIRRTAFDWADEGKVITAGGMRNIPDDLAHTLVDGPKTAAAAERVRDSLAAKLDYYIYDAVNEGVPTPTASVRSIRTLNGTQRGEWSREFAELAFVFKGFPIKAGMTMARQAGSIGGLGGGYHALSLVAQAAVLGYLSGIAKDALRGRTPKRLFDLKSDGSFDQINPNVFLDSVLRGGGLGIFGDLLLSDYDRRYRGALEITAGPVLGEVANVVNLAGQARRVALGEEKPGSLGYQAFRMVENNLPVVGMFPLKSVYEHLVAWQIKEALSPGVFRRSQRTMEKQSHQEYFIEPVH